MTKKISKIEISEHEHAILVQGTGSIEEAREALKQDGWNKATRRLPCRPLWYQEKPGVAFYFHISGQAE